MKKSILLFVSVICVFFVGERNAFAQEKDGKKISFKGYSGGMMFHTGYVKSDPFIVYDAIGIGHEVQIKGMTTGIGGGLHLQFGDHLRIGGKGYSSTVKYNGNESYARQTWGGFLVDCIWQVGKFKPFAGGVVGGGRVRNLTLLNDTPDDFKMESAASYRSYPIITFTPYVGVQFELTQKINLFLKYDYQVLLNEKTPDYVGGGRIYFGIMFSRLTN